MQWLKLTLTLSVICVISIGLVVIYSTSSGVVIDLDLDREAWLSVFKQLVFVVLGLLLAYAVNRLGYQKLVDLAPTFFAVFSLLLFLTLIPGIGKEVNGSRRWIGAAGFYFQPSEFVKFIVPAFFIQQFMNFTVSTVTFTSFIKTVALAFIPIVLILVEPNNGTAAVTASTLVILFLLMRIPYRFWAIPLSLFIVVGGIFALQLPYVSGRINVYLHPELDLQGRGHQPYQAKIAAGSGKVFGKGPGKSWQKHSYLPEAQNDYIAAIYAEEYGFCGILLLVSLYMLIALSGFAIAGYAVDLTAFYLASVITFLMSFQAFLNLGVVSGILPSTGLNLPFFSQGGTSLMANLMGVGLLFNIANETKAYFVSRKNPWRKKIFSSI